MCGPENTGPFVGYAVIGTEADSVPRLTTSVDAPSGIPATDHHCFNGATFRALSFTDTIGVPVPFAIARSATSPTTMSGRDDTTFTSKPVPAGDAAFEWLELEQAAATTTSAHIEATSPLRMMRTLLHAGSRIPGRRRAHQCRYASSEPDSVAPGPTR